MAGKKDIVEQALKLVFGGSKAVDEAGVPVRYYHGTTHDLPVVKPGTYFTEDPGEGSAYTFWTDLANAEKSKGKYSVISAPEMAGKRLKYFGTISDIEGPEVGGFYATDNGIVQYGGGGKWRVASDVGIDDQSLDMSDYTIGIKPYNNSEAAQKMVDEYEEFVKRAYPGGVGGNVIPAYLNVKNPKDMPPLEANRFGERLGADPEWVAGEIEKLKSQGYDSIVTTSDDPFYAMEGKRPPKQYIIFDPTQAKSAIGNEGSYDFTNPRLDKQNGGRTGYAGKGRVIDKGLEAALRIAREGLEGLAKEKGKTPREIGQPFTNQLPRTPFEEWRYEFEPTGQLIDRRPFDVTGFKEGDVLIPFVGDRTSNARKITSIGGQPLAFPTITEGGPDYMRGPAQTKQGSAWASGQGVVTGLNDRLSRALKASEAAGYKDPNAYGVYVAMGPHGGDFSTHTAEAVMGMLPGSKITKKSAKEFDQGMKEVFPDWPGIMSPKAADYVVNANAGEHRKAFLDMIDSAYWRDKGFPDVSLARYATTTPELVDVPTEAAGYAVAKLDPTAPTIEPIVPHRSYPVPMQGEYSGSMPQGLMRDDLFTTFSRNYDLDPPARNYVMGKRRSFGMDPDAFQVLEGRDIEDLVRKVTGLKSEYADGGEVDDDINDAVRIAKDVGGGTTPQVMMEDAKGNKYDAQGNVIPPQNPGPNPARNDNQVAFNLPPENYETEVKPFIEQAVTPMDRPGMTGDPDLVDVMRIATQVAASGQPTDTRGEQNWGRQRAEAVRRAVGADPEGYQSEYRGPFTYNAGDTANYVNTLLDFVAVPEILHDIPYEAGRTGDYGTAAVEGGLNAALTAPGMSALGAAGRAGYNYVRKHPNVVAGLAGLGYAAFPDEAEAGPERWFSKLYRAAEAIPMPRMTGEQALAILRKSAPAEELRWTGTDAFLSGQKSVSKDDLLAHLRANQMQTSDVVLGGGDKPTRLEHVFPDQIPEAIKSKYRDAMNAATKQRVDYLTQMRKLTDEDGDILLDRLDEYRRLKREADYAGDLIDKLGRDMRQEYVDSIGGLGRPTKYETYSTPGGENYRETLITLGNRQKPSVVKQGNSYTLRDKDNNPVFDSNGRVMWFYDKNDAEKAAAFTHRQSAQFKSSHWDDPDVLGHLRTQMLTATPPGANRPYKLFNVDETQSDWAQAGRKQGFFDPVVSAAWQKEYWANKEAVKNAKNALDDAVVRATRDLGPEPTSTFSNAFNEYHDRRFAVLNADPDVVSARRQLDEAIKRENEIKANEPKFGGLPAAPYVTNTQAWTDLSIKKALDQAIDAGADYFTFTPGEVQAARYDLSKEIEGLAYDPDTMQLDYKKKGSSPYGWEIFGSDIPPEKLPDYVGKDVAEKLLATPKDDDGRYMLSGIDLKAGGEGMIDYYNNIYKKRVEKVVKDATGKKVQWEVLPAETAEGIVPRLGFRIDDDVKNATFSTFARGGVVKDNNVVSKALALTSEV